MKQIYLFLVLMLLLSGCSKDDDAQQVRISKLLEGEYNTLIKHYNSDRSKLTMSELAQATIKQDAREPSSYNLFLYDANILLQNIKQVENVVVFSMECVFEGMDEYGYRYILKPNPYYDINGKLYPGYFEMVNDKMMVYLKKEYVDQKNTQSQGYVDIEALKN